MNYWSERGASLVIWERGREVTLHVLNREGSNIHAWDVRETAKDSGTSAGSFERYSFFSKMDLYHPFAICRI